MLQLFVKRNHDVLLYPDWSNASDYKETAESFGTVALHSRELHEALGEVEIADDVTANFTSEMKYLCRAMGIKVPFLTIQGSWGQNFLRFLYWNNQNLMNLSWRLNGASM